MAAASGAVVYDTDNAASFRATLDLTHATRVEIIAAGPLKYPQAKQRASRTLLLLPGPHVEGEGVLLEIGGFIVDRPPVMTADAGQPLTVEILASDTEAANFGRMTSDLTVRPAAVQ